MQQKREHKENDKMANIIIATIFTFLCMATALFMGASGFLALAFVALFCAFVVLAVSIAATFLADI